VGQAGKNADTLEAFFDELGPERCAKLEAVTIDMSGAYIKAVTECSPQAQLIFDRFHVQRLAQDAVDEVRRDEVRAAGSDVERKALKGTRWALHKSFWNLSRFDFSRLATLQRDNRRLYRAYLLKEALVRVLDCRDEGLARHKLDERVRWARRSRLEPFKRIAATIREHAAGILAYVRSGLSNGRTEGSTARRAPSRAARLGFTARTVSSPSSSSAAQAFISTLSTTGQDPPTKPGGEPESPAAEFALPISIARFWHSSEDRRSRLPAPRSSGGPSRNRE
jgi:transposase